MVITMTKLWAIDNFSVEPTSVINGDINAFKFILSTRVPLASGDVVSFQFPDETILPELSQLNVIATER